jgi:hypothetical protein
VLLALCCAAAGIVSLLAWLCGFEANVGNVRELSKEVARFEVSVVDESLVPDIPRP